ncbi:unnamed protein product [Fusarium fujikuroi]|uniref:Uncharacterized protein n=1 Tax=Fusarium fujikuroi TaxID=5127 RepID=A0A9Q9RWS7_FUSFU|nr:unnamed protein product [Fusarium fujikuroi]VTT79685.1 unnamed protein product [Fusarium fujikuroi]VZH99311.1 unnamed protein product [Fusarium fujikuroi]
MPTSPFDYTPWSKQRISHPLFLFSELSTAFLPFLLVLKQSTRQFPPRIYPDRHHEDRALILRLASTPLDGIAENSIGGAHPVVCNAATRYRGRVCIHYLGSLKALGKQVTIFRAA